MRGKPRIRASRPRLSRIIPARAGKTVVVLLFMSGVPDHPRACGENSGKARDRCRTWGSSPRVRGKLTEIVVSSQEERIIPARAGKTSPSSPARPFASAHPRACGENETWCSSTWGTGGSSPRVRGKLDERREGTPLRGLIPARAGKTGGWAGRACALPAHPRACGENHGTWSRVSAVNGSSPRVRGKPRRSCCSMDNGGLIPARAGKTRTGSRRR